MIKASLGAIALVFFGAVGSISPTVQAQSNTPADAQNHWARGCLTAMKDRGWLVGDGSGRVYPERVMGQRDFATLLKRAWGPEMKSPLPVENVPLTRGTAFTMMARSLGLPPDQRADLLVEQTYIDAEGIPAAVRPGVAAVTRKGWGLVYPNPRRLGAATVLKRGEAAALICQSLADRLESPATNTLQSFVVRVPEVRGVWLTNVDSDVLYDRDAMEAAFAELSRLNFNTVYPVVWHNGATLFPSNTFRRATGASLASHPRLQGRDVLRELAAAGKKHGLTVIPWLEFGMMVAPESAIAQQHPEWLSHRADGTKTTQAGAEQRAWLNPTHPEVQQFLIDLTVEIVRKYPVAGIQWDDHFGWPADFGYSPTTVAAYQAAFPGETPPANDQDPRWAQWQNWRRDQLSKLFGRISQAVKAAKSDAVISLSPNPYHFANPTSLQDWARWSRSGWIDELIVQVYRNDMPRFQQELGDRTLQNVSQTVPVSIGLLSGLKAKPVSALTLDQQVRAVRNRQLSGVSFFFYETLWNLTNEPTQQRQWSIRRWFFNPAPRPITIKRPLIPPSS
ncbi:MAG: family 10 glycosylhydrolase [Cyanobacteria bacterium P01_F01_bin.153]